MRSIDCQSHVKDKHLACQGGQNCCCMVALSHCFEGLIPLRGLVKEVPRARDIVFSQLAGRGHTPSAYCEYSFLWNSVVVHCVVSHGSCSRDYLPGRQLCPLILRNPILVFQKIPLQNLESVLLSFRGWTGFVKVYACRFSTEHRRGLWPILLGLELDIYVSYGP